MILSPRTLHHKKERNPIRLEEVSDPSAEANTGFVYTGDDAGDTELFYLDDAGAEVQITKDGFLNGAAVGGFTPTSVLFASGTGAITEDAGFVYNSGTDTLTVANITSSGVHLVGDGSVTAVSLGHAGDPNCGWFFPAADHIGYVTAGTEWMRQSDAGQFRLHPSAVLAWAPTSAMSTSDLILTRDAANVLAQRNGTNAQESRLYNTFTDASNNEYLTFSWSISANVLSLGTKASGSGTARQLNILTGGSAGAAIIVFTTSSGANGGVRLGPSTSIAGSAGDSFVSTGSAAFTGTTGVRYGFRVQHGGAPTGTSTMEMYALGITPTFNWSAGTPGAGRAIGLYIAPTIPALPTGNNGAIVLSSAAAGSTGLNGIQLYNTSDETSAYERAVHSWVSNVYTITTGVGTGGTIRAMQVGAGAAVGTDTAGANTTIVGGNSTGTGAGGSIIFQTAPAAGGSGSSANTLTTALTINSAGQLIVAQAGSASACAITLVDAGTGFIRPSANRIGICSSSTEWAQLRLGGFIASSTTIFGWTDGTAASATVDTRLGREAAAIIQMGADVNGAAVHQTFKAHDGITGTDIAGANLTLAGGRGTGAGAPGTLIFQTATTLGTGTTAQTLATRFTIAADASVWSLSSLGLVASANHRFAHGTSALATNATEGFFHMNSCAGAPTGVPASIPTGQIPMVFDTTNARLYFYHGGAWHYVAQTA